LYSIGSWISSYWACASWRMLETYLHIDGTHSQKRTATNFTTEPKMKENKKWLLLIFFSFYFLIKWEYIFILFQYDLRKYCTQRNLLTLKSCFLSFEYQNQKKTVSSQSLAMFTFPWKRQS
jgi:hypothetical protein